MSWSPFLISCAVRARSDSLCHDSGCYPLSEEIMVPSQSGSSSCWEANHKILKSLSFVVDVETSTDMYFDILHGRILMRSPSNISSSFYWCGFFRFFVLLRTDAVSFESLFLLALMRFFPIFSTSLYWCGIPSTQIFSLWVARERSSDLVSYHLCAITKCFDVIGNISRPDRLWDMCTVAARARPVIV